MTTTATRFAVIGINGTSKPTCLRLAKDEDLHWDGDNLIAKNTDGVTYTWTRERVLFVKVSDYRNGDPVEDDRQ